MHVRYGLDLDRVCTIFIPDGLDLLISGINNLPVKCEDPAVGRVCLVLLTDLIIRRGGKLLCQLFLWGKWFGWCGLGGIFDFEGLDKRFCWGFCGVRRRFFRFELWAMSCVV